jgi:hypothetical protein
MSTWISPLPLGINSPHCINFPHYMGKILLNLTFGETLALVNKLYCFDNPIEFFLC